MNKVEYFNKEVTNKFEDLIEEAKDLKVDKIFKMIGELDNQFSDDEFYKLNIGGVIANIGIDRRNVKLLNEGIKRVKKCIENESNEFSLNKLKYDIGNIINTKADIKYSNSINNMNDTEKFGILFNLEEYLEARYYYTQVKYELDNFDIYSRAKTNSANILDLYGRNYEAIMLYNKVLNHKPNFGMALGNKAIAIIYYYNLTPDKFKENALLIFAKELFEKALENRDNILNVGGENALETFEFHINKLKDFISENDIKNRNFSNKIEDEYKEFVLDKNLFLNYHFGFVINNNSLKDYIIPPLFSDIEDVDSGKYSGFSKDLFYSIKQLNQIIENFSSARYMYYLANKSDLKEADDITEYIYALDYTRNNLKYGLMKSVFTKLFNILDKVANFIYIYPKYS